MNKQMLYRGLLRIMPPKRLPLTGHGLSHEGERALQAILRRHRCTGGSFRLFDGNTTFAAYDYGMAPGTAYRIASISKMLTAACALKLAEEDLLDLHAPVETYLPYAVRHPRALGTPITLNMLLTHTAALKDGTDYTNALSALVPANAVLAGDSWHDHLPGEKWQYSNFGAGLAGCVLEGALGCSFERLMQRYLFEPLGVTASFYPQFIAGPLANARRVMPPARKSGFDAAERKMRPAVGADEVRPFEHYLMAQGNACMASDDLARFLQALMRPEYLREETLQAMHTPVVDFGERSRHMRQGPGLFRVEDKRVSLKPLFGHQGNAYGAVHGAFFEPETKRGMVFLSVGASEARREFLADIVEDLLRFSFSEDTWKQTL